MSNRVFDAQLCFLENGIPFHTSGYRQCRPGWIQIACPFCGGHPHLGFNTEKGYFNCYSCGHKRNYQVLEALGFSNIKKVLERYGNRRVRNVTKELRRAKKCILPMSHDHPRRIHSEYLEGRGLNWKKIQNVWDISFTDQITETGYAWRIVIPIYHDNRLISFQARAVDKKDTLRYRTCPANKEVKNVKETLYGIDKVAGDTVVVTEGVFDVWKLGPGAVCTFGIDYSIHQLRLLSERFRRVFILFDWVDQQARDQAEKLAHELELLGSDAEVVELNGVKDPGELPLKDAKKIMEELLGGD